jgi:methionine-gamma-lyase
MGAISTLLLSTLKPGDTIITQGNLYGGTDEFIQKVLIPLQIKAHLINLQDLDAVEVLLQEDKTIRLMYIETPANPTLACYDIDKLSLLAKKHDVLCAVDNTFATPYLQQPFKYAVDFVVHSTTKFLNGHGNAIGGAMIARNKNFFNTRVHEVMKLVGSNANPFDAWLLNNGLKTLEIRMQRHCDNAMQLANYFEQHPAIHRVNYPGLNTHNDFNICKKQMRHAGAMMSIELHGGLQAGKKFISALKLVTLAVSLGTVDTIVQHPASMSHNKMSKLQREQYGITDGLIRISVGIENFDDLMNDFEQALKKCQI